MNLNLHNLTNVLIKSSSFIICLIPSVFRNKNNKLELLLAIVRSTIGLLSEGSEDFLENSNLLAVKLD